LKIIFDSRYFVLQIILPMSVTYLSQVGGKEDNRSLTTRIFGILYRNWWSWSPTACDPQWTRFHSFPTMLGNNLYLTNYNKHLFLDRKLC